MLGLALQINNQTIQ